MKKKYRPLRDVVAVERDAPRTLSKIIIVPERARPLAWTGKVYAIGPEVTEVKVGDRVYLPLHYSVSAWIDDRHILFYLEEEILAKVER